MTAPVDTADEMRSRGLWVHDPPPSRRAALKAVGREALAMLRQAGLLHRDVLPTGPWGRPFSGESADGRRDVVFLLHGLFATAGVLRPMREKIEALTGAEAASFTYAPGLGVEGLARRLGELVDTLPGRPRVHLVGHSLGGLVVRYYVQELARRGAVAQTISLASPFGGSRHARLMPGPAGREIAPGSPMLLRVCEGAKRVTDIPHLSIAAAHDLMVERQGLGVGDHLTVDAVGHNGLLYHPAVIDEVVRRIRAVQARGSTSCAGTRPEAFCEGDETPA